MSNLSIYEKKWLDIVFEGRNQSYGAYQLRLENSRTTIISLFLGTLLFGVALSGLVLKKTSIEQAPILTHPDKIISISDILPPTPPKPKTEILPATSSSEKQTTEKRLINPVVVKNTEKTDDVMKNVDAIKPTTTIADSQTTNGTNITTTINENRPTTSSNSTVITASLDKLPEFPGGISKFLSYVGDNFREPDFRNSDVDGSKAIRVIVSFVIEKDGSMTDIKVLRDPGYKLGEEAIRVLKSQKTKWKPGVKDGQTVRTLYTLPITIIPQ